MKANKIVLNRIKGKRILLDKKNLEPVKLGITIEEFAKISKRLSEAINKMY